ncbi:MAG: response regulator transcription factor [Andreesenia angusta]|nr:response regulator transcription factor [Andreesenia angusta]
MLKILLVEDHKVLSESFSILLNSSNHFEVIANTRKASEAYDLCKKYKPDIVLMDVYTADGNGIDAAEIIKKDFPNIKVYILTGMKELILIKRAEEIGADGYIYKDIHPKDLINMLKLSIDDYKIFPNSFGGNSAFTEEPYDFTKLEIEILQFLCCGFDLNSIGKKLGYSPNTIKTYLSKMLEKSGFDNRSQLLAYVTKKGYIDPELIFDRDTMERI